MPSSKFFIYLFFIVAYNINCVAMELAENDDVRPVLLKLTKTEERTIKINNHFFLKAGFFKVFDSLKTEIIIGSDSIKNYFGGLISGNHATENFIESLKEEYNVDHYFNCFNKNSFEDLCTIYTWYNFIAYPEMEDIICATILVKACSLDLIHPKSYYEFTQCTACTEKNEPNFRPLNNYQKNHHKQLAQKISDTIPADIKKSENETFIRFSENICKILDLCNTSHYHKAGLKDVLCACQKSKNEDDILLNDSLKPNADQLVLKNLVCENIKKNNQVNATLCLTNMTLKNKIYINIKEFTQAFNNTINNVLLNNVHFSNPDNTTIDFLSDLRDPAYNNAQALSVYLTGKETRLTGKYKFSDTELSFKLLNSIYKKNQKIGNFTSTFIPATLLVDSETINKNLQKKLNCNSIYYTRYYFIYSQIKRMLLDPGFILFSVPLGSCADLVLSLGYNAFFAHKYGGDHFIVPVSLLGGALIGFFNSLHGVSGPEDTEYQQECRRKNAIPISCCFICITLLVTFYIFKEIKYKPFDWHTYSFFPWTTAAFYIGLMAFSTKKNEDNYEEIKDGKVEFVKNIEAVLN